MNSILSYLGKVNASFLHANGRPATAALIHHLNCRPYEHILEIGHGTGATLVLLKSKYRKTKFTGIDRSEIMHQKAKNRLRFCGIKDIPLLINNSLSIPFPNNTFDKIYLESVLGIQERNDLKSMLKEIKRVLKPHGRLVMNETIWLESTSLSRINSINQYCKSEFGIIQANSEYPYLADWKLLIQEIGFLIEIIESLDQLKIKYTFKKVILSELFSHWGKMISFLSPSLSKERKALSKRMKSQKSDVSLMSGYLFSLTKQ